MAEKEDFYELGRKHSENYSHETSERSDDCQAVTGGRGTKKLRLEVAIGISVVTTPHESIFIEIVLQHRISRRFSKRAREYRTLRGPISRAR